MAHVGVQRQCDVQRQGDPAIPMDQGRRVSEVIQRNRNVRMPKLPKSLSGDEKKYLLAVERGDIATVRRMIQQSHREGSLDVNCMDSLGRNALLLAIESEQFSMVELLVVMGVRTSDGLLHAIDQEFVEAVELLLEHEELIHKEGEPYSWENINRDTACFTPEITPLILAAHQNNYEILKILLDRGATLPMPHDIRCACDECVKGARDDSLRHSASRINSYKALASPSLIALTSVDPLLTAFELSWELKQLSFSEKEFRGEYLDLRMRSQTFAVDLLSHTRTTHELEVMLNYDPQIMKDDDDAVIVDELDPGESSECGLARLRLAITYKQKKFVAHPWVQQLLAAIWYDGLPGFRQKTTIQKCMDIARVIVLFPFYCLVYMIAPKSGTGKLVRKPFMKFLIHSSSYLFFLFLLILVSQRVEEQIVDWWESRKYEHYSDGSIYRKRHRGNEPRYLELIVVLYLLGYIAEEARELVKSGFKAYTADLWNAIDFIRNSLYVFVVLLRTWAYVQQTHEISIDAEQAYIPREHWDDYDPQLIAEGLLAAANIFSALKLVQISSINPHLGPLQVSLGRMVVDILKFFFFYSLVLFAFACGLNQLLWYFADLEKAKCYSLPGGLPDWNKNAEACMKWRRFGNLFESSQSLFWASFGMVGLDAFELTGIKSYTRFWGLLMFGSYCVINVIVLLNLLIAMMSNSYTMISEKADTEWKFARTKLWLTYFDEGATLPSPFNMFPTYKQIKRIVMRFFPGSAKTISKHKEARMSELREQAREYTAVMRALVWRYVSWRQRRAIEDPVTGDDINEIKTEVSTLRCDLFEVFRSNGFKITGTIKRPVALSKKSREWERRLFKGFHVAPAAGDEDILLSVQTEKEQLEDDSFNCGEERGADRFRRMARLALMNRDKLIRPPKHLAHIGKSTSSESFKSRQVLKKAMAEAQKMVRAGNPQPSPIPQSPEPVADPELQIKFTPEKRIIGNQQTLTSNTGSSYSTLSASDLLSSGDSILDQPNPPLGPTPDAYNADTKIEHPKSPSSASTGSNSSSGKKSPRMRELSQSKVCRSFPESPDVPPAEDTMISMETEPTESPKTKSSNSGDISVEMGSTVHNGAADNIRSIVVGTHGVLKGKTDHQQGQPGSGEIPAITEPAKQNSAALKSNVNSLTGSVGDTPVASTSTGSSARLMDLPVAGQKVDGVNTIKRPNAGGSWF